MVVTSMTVKIKHNQAEITSDEVIQYVRDAVRQWSKGGHPEDPLYKLTDEDIEITKIPRKRA